MNAFTDQTVVGMQVVCLVILSHLRTFAVFILMFSLGLKFGLNKCLFYLSIDTSHVPHLRRVAHSRQIIRVPRGQRLPCPFFQP